MRRLYHLTSPRTWEQLGRASYQADTLSAEGFIHCSHAHQVEWVANTFYHDAADLVALVIDPALLGSEVREEGPAGGERFPHVYGPIEREAILGAEPLERDATGRWAFRPAPPQEPDGTS